MAINSIFRDPSNTFTVDDDVKTYRKFIFRRQDILNFVEEVGDKLELLNRLGVAMEVLRDVVNRAQFDTVCVSLRIVGRKLQTKNLMQVLLALHFYTTGTFHVLGELFGLSKRTSNSVRVIVLL